MRAEEIRDLSDVEIRDRVGELEEERFRLRFRSATETLDNALRLRVIRRDVARMKTIMRERALGKVSVSAPVTRKAAAKGTRTKAKSKGGKAR
jgi:large subunit ribosomal protein L29